MGPQKMLQQLLNRSRTHRPQGRRRRGVRLALERLEDRSLPSSLTGATLAVPSLEQHEPQHYHIGSSYPGGMIALAGIGDGVQTNWDNNGRHGSKGTSGSGDGFGGVL